MSDFLDSDELKVERLEADIERLTREAAEERESRAKATATVLRLTQEDERQREEIEQLRDALHMIADGEAKDYSHCIRIARKALHRAGEK